MQIETTQRTIAAFRERPHLVRLECGVQHYDWGDPEAIPRLLGQPNPQRRPFAELWAGAHPDLPSVALMDGIRVPLDELVGEAADQVLGARVARRFKGELPFLLKVLAARKPLSIQVHPDEHRARAGFERENQRGLPLDAATRSYHDPHHKPELLVALTDFYALRGFRPQAEIEEQLAATPELAALDRHFQSHGRALASLYRHIMYLDQAQTNALLSPLIERLERAHREHPFPIASRERWLLRADREYSAPGHRDPGLFSLLLLNLVRLRPGQAVFLPARELHAYLQGVGVELMANSNNVLRGGLTHKYVDVEELLDNLSYRTAPAEILEGTAPPDQPGLTDYPTPSDELALHRLRLPAGQTFENSDRQMTLALITAGQLAAKEGGRAPIELRGGDGLLAPQGTRWQLAASEEAVCWLARVPGGGTTMPQIRSPDPSAPAPQ
jgi:mannose-6-phosphate isomerase class I